MKTGCATAMPCPISSHQVLILWEKVEELLIRWLMNPGCRSSLNRREAFDKRSPHPQFFIKSTRLPLKQGGRCWRGGGVRLADWEERARVQLMEVHFALERTDWCTCPLYFRTQTGVLAQCRTHTGVHAHYTLKHIDWCACQLYLRPHRLVEMHFKGNGSHPLRGRQLLYSGLKV